jgi:hypothetical protein
MYHQRVGGGFKQPKITDFQRWDLSEAANLLIFLARPPTLTSQ